MQNIEFSLLPSIDKTHIYHKKCLKIVHNELLEKHQQSEMYFKIFCEFKSCDPFYLPYKYLFYSNEFYDCTIDKKLLER